MLVLAAVPAIQFHKLRRAAAPRFPVVHARSWDDALATIRARPVELAAVDPQLEGGPRPHEIERLRVLFPSLPLILYTALSPATAAVLLALGHSGITAVVFTRLDDRPAPRLRPDQDAAAPRPRLSRPHRRRDAAHARAPPGARAHRPGLRSAAPDAGFGMTTGAPHPPSPPSPPPRPSTILVVEDDGALRRVLERVLARQGYRVLAAASAETAYELLASEPADAVLLDVQLPTMSGLALYLALIHRHPNLAGRIAIMSGDAEADHVRTWLQHNPCTVLKKPFDLREIVEWAHELLDVSDRQTENGA